MLYNLNSSDQKEDFFFLWKTKYILPKITKKLENKIKNINIKNDLLTEWKAIIKDFLSEKNDVDIGKIWEKEVLEFINFIKQKIWEK